MSDMEFNNGTTYIFVASSTRQKVPLLKSLMKEKGLKGTDSPDPVEPQDYIHIRRT